MQNKKPEMKRIAREKEKKCKALEKRGKKAEAEKNKKNKGTAKKRPIRPSDVANPKQQRIYEDECDFNIEKYQLESVLYVLVIGKRITDEWLMCTNDQGWVWSHREKVMMHTFVSYAKLVFCNESWSVAHQNTNWYMVVP